MVSSLPFFVSSQETELNRRRSTAGGVGKSALTFRFMRDEFVENYDPTIEGVRTPTLNTSCFILMRYASEEYRRAVDVDGQLILVSIILALAARPSALPADCRPPIRLILHCF